MKKRFYLFLVLVFALFLVGCGASGNSSSGGSISQDPSYNENGILIETNRKIYYNVYINIECDNITDRFNYYINKAVEFDGYMSNSNLNSESYGSVVLRIPTDKLNDFLNLVDNDKESEVVNKSISSNDVTSKYNQMEARLEVLKASRASYVSILEKASSINEIISLNSRIEDIDSEILQLENSLSYYDNLVDYSTVEIRLSTEFKEEGFLSGYFDYIINVFKVILSIILYTLPFAFIAGVVLTLIFGIKKIKKNKKNIE